MGKFYAPKRGIFVDYETIGDSKKLAEQVRSLRRHNIGTESADKCGIRYSLKNLKLLMPKEMQTVMIFWQEQNEKRNAEYKQFFHTALEYPPLCAVREMRQLEIRGFIMG